ncbi:MAG: PIG-L deacetylase family protein [Nanoarchaeota archaeon]
MPQRETILVLSAHSDDFVLGAGGTIARYAQQGKKVLVVVFSYGEKSHPWMKKQVIKPLRAREAREASRILRCRVKFFDLPELSYLQTYQRQGVDRQLLRLLEHIKPNKIFTHSDEDPHPDHRAVHQITMDVWNKARRKPDVYLYSIWNPISIKTRYPALYTDISATFNIKMAALRKFPSQRYNAIYPLLLLVLFRAVKDGIHLGKSFGEHFFKVR